MGLYAGMSLQFTAVHKHHVEPWKHGSTYQSPRAAAGLRCVAIANEEILSLLATLLADVFVFFAHDLVNSCKLRMARLADNGLQP